VADVSRQRRPRTTTTIAATVSVLAVAVLGLLLVPRLRGSAVPAVTPTVNDTAAFDRAYGSMYRTTGVPQSGRFIDADRAYLLMLRCPDIPKQAQDLGSCTQRLDVTTDGATFAVGPPLPGRGAPTLGTSLWVFDNGALVFQDPSGRWVSNNAGQSWAAVPTATAGSLASIPADAKLVPDPAPNSVMPLVLTSDGKTYALSTAAPHDSVVPGELNSLNGDPIDGVFFLAHGADLKVSTNRGATWQAANTGTAVVAQLLGSDGRRLYAFSAVDNTTGAPIRPKILVSQDHGLSWSTVSIPPASEPGQHEGQGIGPLTLAVLPSGGVLVADGVRLWRLATDGGTLQAIPLDGTLGVRGLRGVVLRMHANGSSTTFQLSTDGGLWYTATFG
jgi:hypothetical protein